MSDESITDEPDRREDQAVSDTTRVTDEQADRTLTCMFAPMSDDVQTLAAYIRHMREDVGWRESVLEEVRETLAALGCGCHDAKATPPMMYSEWIKCVVAHHRFEATGEAKG